MRDKIKERWKTLKSHIKHYVLTFLYWIYNLSGKKLFKIRPGDVTMGPGYKRHYLAENGGQKLYMSEHRRSRVIAVMNKADEFDRPKEDPDTPEMSSEDQENIHKWHNRARNIYSQVENERKMFEKGKK